MCRSATEMPESAKEKISMFSHVDKEQVICLADVNNIYRVPLILFKYNLADWFIERLQLKELPSKNLLVNSFATTNFELKLNSNVIMQRWSDLAEM